MRTCAVVILLLLFSVMLAHAGEAEIIAVEVKNLGDRSYRFDVTVSHRDEGWKHYVNKWDILGADDRVLGTRTLFHPHVDEQPFTRSLSGVKIADGIDTVRVRAHDSVHRYGGKTATVVLPR